MIVFGDKQAVPISAPFTQKAMVSHWQNNYLKIEKILNWLVSQKEQLPYYNYQNANVGWMALRLNVKGY